MPVHLGYCDSLDTPRALGPLHDIARHHGRGLDAAAAHRDAPAPHHAVFLDPPPPAPRSPLWRTRTGPTRRRRSDGGGRPARDGDRDVWDEEVGRERRRVLILGDLAHRVLGAARHRCRRCRASRSWRSPNRSAATATAVDEVTAGNPFSPSEALGRCRTSRSPASVRDAVLARAARFGAAARRVLSDRGPGALTGPRVALLKPIAGSDGGALDERARTRTPVVDSVTVRFRHELARMAVE